MKAVDFGPLRRWTSKGLTLSSGTGETFHSADDTNSFTMLIGRAVERWRPRQVLDLGCGCGIPMIEAAARGAPLVQGVEISEANAGLARRNVSLAGLDDRVTVHQADWREVLREAKPDLLVSNPPYVPRGSHATVDGGTDGAEVLRAMVNAVPGSTRGLALLFGSISNPIRVVQHIEEQGWAIQRLICHVVPFGRYTSTPAAVDVLRALQGEERAWFHEAWLEPRHVLRTYLVFGVIAERCLKAVSLAAAMEGLLEGFQRSGWRGLRRVVRPLRVEYGVYRAAMPGEGALQGRRGTIATPAPALAATARDLQQASEDSENHAIVAGGCATVPGAL